jgi:hypothetical protein
MDKLPTPNSERQESADDKIISELYCKHQNRIERPGCSRTKRVSGPHLLCPRNDCQSKKDLHCACANLEKLQEALFGNAH